MNVNQGNSIQQNSPQHSQTIEPINRQDQSTINRLRAAVNVCLFTNKKILKLTKS